MKEKFIIREAMESDTSAMAQVNVDTRRVTYKSFYPAHLLAGMSYEKVEKAWTQLLWNNPESSNNIALVAETANGKIAGILIGGKEKSDDKEYKGEIYVLYVLPEYQNQNIGRQLVKSAVGKLLEINITSLLIWVLAENPSRNFYKSMGGEPVREKEIDLGEIKMKEIGYGWKDIRNAILKKI